MTTLENLWYGNIRQVEEFVDGNTYCDISGIRKKMFTNYDTVRDPPY